MAYLRDIDFGPQLVDYLERIDRSLEPFGGRFLMHGGELQPVEGVPAGYTARQGLEALLTG